MTSLELAEKIMRAVLDASCGRSSSFVWKESERQAVQAVLRVLYDEGCWFCRLHDSPEHGTQRIVLPLIDLSETRPVPSEQL